MKDQVFILGKVRAEDGDAYPGIDHLLSTGPSPEIGGEAWPNGVLPVCEPSFIVRLVPVVVRLPEGDVYVGL